MKRFPIVISLALAVGLLLQGSAFAATPAPADRAAIAALLTAKLTSVNRLVVGAMFQEGAYVVAQWRTGDGNGGGEALVKNDGAKWILVKQGGGSMANAPFLESLGVSAKAAQALVVELQASDAKTTTMRSPDSWSGEMYDVKTSPSPSPRP